MEADAEAKVKCRITSRPYDPDFLFWTVFNRQAGLFLA
jgi:hypothetical protein